MYNTAAIAARAAIFARDTLVTQIPSEYARRLSRHWSSAHETSKGSPGVSWRAFVALGRVKLMPP